MRIDVRKFGKSTGDTKSGKVRGNGLKLAADQLNAGEPTRDFLVVNKIDLNTRLEWPAVVSRRQLFFRCKVLFALLNEREASHHEESLRNLKLPDNSKLERSRVIKVRMKGQ